MVLDHLDEGFTMLRKNGGHSTCPVLRVAEITQPGGGPVNFLAQILLAERHLDESVPPRSPLPITTRKKFTFPAVVAYAGGLHVELLGGNLE